MATHAPPTVTARCSFAVCRNPLALNFQKRLDVFFLFSLSLSFLSVGAAICSRSARLPFRDYHTSQSRGRHLQRYKSGALFANYCRVQRTSLALLLRRSQRGRILVTRPYWIALRHAESS